jgi:putative thioredoxin
MTANVRDIDTAEFAQAVVERSRQVPVVVDFWAAWCGPCKVLGPILERVAAEADGEWELVKVDVDQNQQLAMQFGVQGIPTVVGFRDGQPVARFTGALPETAVRQWLRELVPSELDRAAAEGVAALERGDDATAEAVFRRVLQQDPAHVEAATGLAALLIDRGDGEEALAVLGKLPTTDEVRRLQAAARMLQAGGDVTELRQRVAENPEDWQARLELGRALAVAGPQQEALDHLLEVVGARVGDLSDQARLAMLDLFDLLGDHPLVAEYRKKLANALF